MSSGSIKKLTLGALICVVLGGCGGSDPATDAVRSGIHAHGGDLFEAVEVRFAFRGVRFLVRREGGEFHYERVYADPDGRLVREWMTNQGTQREIDGQAQDLSTSERNAVETAVNSVVYFGFLPFRLLDDAATHRDLGTVELDGRTYRKVEVTFQEEGGGADWEDRFVYWFDAERHTLDYLAYRYHRDGGGTRFRRAVNRRDAGGLLLQDYENYTAAEPLDDIADYDRLLGNGELELLSMVELEDVQVQDLR